jgi:hypothetical protein
MPLEWMCEAAGSIQLAQVGTCYFIFHNTYKTTLTRAIVNILTLMSNPISALLQGASTGQPRKET